MVLRKREDESELNGSKPIKYIEIDSFILGSFTNKYFHFTPYSPAVN